MTTSKTLSPVLVLASGSPRRREMLEQFGLRLNILPPDVDETLPKNITLEEALRQVAERKANAVAKRLEGNDYVLAADTVVAVGEEVLGKPRDPRDAARMLAMLAGKTHRVLTAVALSHGGRMDSFVENTHVRFRQLTPAQIDWYVATGEPLDKAGAYAIQGLASAFIETIEGSYTNVVGLPLAETLELLESAGFPVWR